MSVDWDRMGVFVQNVGVPFAVLLLFCGPFIYLLFTLIRKYGGRIAESHMKFMDSAAATQEQNAATLSRLEETVASKHVDHTATHHAIGLVAAAGISMLDNDHKQARTKLERVEHVLAPRYTREDK